jgi:hypothetical protein
MSVVILAASLFTARSQRALALAAKDRAEISSQGANDATVLITELLTEIVSKPSAAPRTSQDILAEASRLAGLLGRVDNDEELRTLEPTRLQTLRIATNSTIKLLLEMRIIILQTA